MENKLSNEELARVFSMYKYCLTKVGGRKLLYCGHTPNFESAVVCNPSANPSSILTMWCDWEEIEIEAIPLSQISDEDAIEVAKIHDHHNIKSHYSAEDLRSYMIAQGKRMVITMQNDVRVYEELKRRGYAVKLYCFGVGHWANGKTAIQLGGAIDEAL